MISWKIYLLFKHGYFGYLYVEFPKIYLLSPFKHGYFNGICMFRGVFGVCEIVISIASKNLGDTPPPIKFGLIYSSPIWFIVHFFGDLPSVWLSCSKSHLNKTKIVVFVFVTKGTNYLHTFSIPCVLVGRGKQENLQKQPVVWCTVPSKTIPEVSVTTCKSTNCKFQVQWRIFKFIMSKGFRAPMRIYTCSGSPKNCLHSKHQPKMYKNNILFQNHVKLDHFPRDPMKIPKIFETTT